MMILDELLHESVKLVESLDAAAKKLGLVKKKLPAYHDAKDTKRYALQTDKGKTKITVDVNPKDSSWSSEKGNIEVRVNDQSTKYFKKMTDAVEFIEKQKIPGGDVTPPDTAIIKWIGDQLSFKIKPENIKKMKYIDWGKSIQLIEGENMHQFPHLLFAEGDNPGDDQAALGEINMTLKDFKAWLEKHGVTKTKKPTSPRYGSYYD